MKVPPVKPASFEAALTMFRERPGALLEHDRGIFLHCQETAVRSEAPVLATSAFTLAHHTVLIECHQRQIVPPPAHDGMFAELMREMIELGPLWDDEITRRLQSDQRNFHTVFDLWAKKKRRPELIALVRHNALRAFRIFELVLQPL